MPRCCGCRSHGAIGNPVFMRIAVTDPPLDARGSISGLGTKQDEYQRALSHQGQGSRLPNVRISRNCIDTFALGFRYSNDFELPLLGSHLSVSVRASTTSESAAATPRSLTQSFPRRYRFFLKMDCSTRWIARGDDLAFVLLDPGSDRLPVIHRRKR